jgi:hypothetical protein
MSNKNGSPRAVSYHFAIRLDFELISGTEPLIFQPPGDLQNRGLQAIGRGGAGSYP